MISIKFYNGQHKKMDVRIGLVYMFLYKVHGVLHYIYLVIDENINERERHTHMYIIVGS